VSGGYEKELGQLSGIVLGYGLDDQGSESQKGLGIFLCTTVSKPTLGPTQWVPVAPSLGVKWSADHSPPSSAEVQNMQGCTSTPTIRLHDMVLS